MDKAERPINEHTEAEADAHVNPPADAVSGRRVGSVPGFGNLTDEIDRLRSQMSEQFNRERSFTADSVISVSRQLDLKINEYMRSCVIRRGEAG